MESYAAWNRYYCRYSLHYPSAGRKSASPYLGWICGHGKYQWPLGKKTLAILLLFLFDANKKLGLSFFCSLAPRNRLRTHLPYLFFAVFCDGNPATNALSTLASLEA